MTKYLLFIFVWFFISGCKQQTDKLFLNLEYDKNFVSKDALDFIHNDFFRIHIQTGFNNDAILIIINGGPVIMGEFKTSETSSYAGGTAMKKDEITSDHLKIKINKNEFINIQIDKRYNFMLLNYDRSKNTLHVKFTNVVQSDS